MSTDKKENSDATITRLANADSPFFKGKSNELIGKEDKDIEVEKVSQPNINSTQTVPILERLRKANMLVHDSGLGPSFHDEYRRI